MSVETNMNVEDMNPQDTVQSSPSVEEHNDVSSEAQLSQQNKRNDADHNWAEMRRQNKWQIQKKDQEIDPTKVNVSPKRVVEIDVRNIATIFQ